MVILEGALFLHERGTPVQSESNVARALSGWPPSMVIRGGGRFLMGEVPLYITGRNQHGQRSLSGWPLSANHDVHDCYSQPPPRAVIGP